jgi:hypothetical protein
MDFIPSPFDFLANLNYFAAGFLFLNIRPKMARTIGPATSSCQTHKRAHQPVRPKLLQ